MFSKSIDHQKIKSPTRPRLDQLFLFLLIGFAITLPIGSKINNYFLVGVALIWLYQTVTKKLYKSIFPSQEFWLAATLYLLYVGSLVYTQNISQGLRDIEYKLPLLILPLLLLTSIRLQKETVTKVFSWYCFSCVAVAGYILLAGFLKSGQIEQDSIFFYHELAGLVKMNAVYLSAYFAMAGFFLVHQLFSSLNFSALKKVIFTSSFFLLSSCLLLLSSKTIISVYVLLILAFILQHFTKKGKFALGISFAIVLGAAILIAVVFTPNLKKRIDDVTQAPLSVLNQERFEYNTPFSGLTLRLLFWKYAILIVDRENAWLQGVGTGDSQDALNAMYVKHNLYTGNSHNGPQDIGYLDFNTHNQFVETLLKIGIIGFLYFAFYLTRALFLSLRKKDVLYAAFLILFISFSLSESTLQGNKGIVFFAFFNTMFLSYLTKKRRQNDSIEA